VVLANNEPPGTAPLALRMSVGPGMGAASVLALTASSPSATGGVLLGGHTVASIGAWKAPTRTQSVATHAGVLTLHLLPSSAALVTVNRRPTGSPGVSVSQTSRASGLRRPHRSGARAR
jgi:hypothetical protein